MQQLATGVGLQRLIDKFFRYHGLITRRGFKTPEILANHIYTLTAGLRRQVPANLAFQAIWAEHLSEKLGEEGAENLGKLADAVNACLEDDKIVAEKEADLDKALNDYRAALATSVGDDFARLDMLIKAVPAVADRLRAGIPASTPDSPPAEEAAPPADAE